MKVILVGLVLGLMAATACDVESDELATDPKAPINAAGVESWDLRTPPTRADVGMKDGEDFVAYEDDANPRPIEVLLPQATASNWTTSRWSPRSRVQSGQRERHRHREMARQFREVIPRVRVRGHIGRLITPMTLPNGSTTLPPR